LKKSEVKSQFYSDSSNGDKHHGIPDEHDAQPATRNPQPATRNPQPATRNPQPATRNAQPTPRLTQTTIWQKKRFGDMRIIGQLHNTYIIGEADEGLILIDQHAAHERILFEQFSDRATNSPKAAQRLLVPESVELGYREAEALEKLIPNLAELGLDIEPFGGNTFVIKSVPPLLAQREVKPLLVEIVEKIVEIGSSTGLAELLDECRMVMACHGAIRANQALSDKQISGLMTQLDECHNPSHCPHGRPTWIRWDIRTLEKSFKRVV
jgi:DNA mismatch repair protein MutL